MHSSNLSIGESRITCAYCMQGALNFHIWLIDIVQHAIESSSSSCRTWIEKLASDVWMAVNQKKTVVFYSIEYLPKLKLHKIYTYTPRPFRYDQTEIFSTTLSSILRLWLHFPSDELSLLQLSLIGILMSKSLSSILLLDNIWEMYSTPFLTVFNVWNARSSKKNIDKSLAEFQRQFESHPFASAGSLEYQKLKHLSKLFDKWILNNGLDSGSSTVGRHQICSSISLTNLCTRTWTSWWPQQTSHSLPVGPHPFLKHLW